MLRKPNITALSLSQTYCSLIVQWNYLAAGTIADFIRIFVNGSAYPELHTASVTGIMIPLSSIGGGTVGKTFDVVISAYAKIWDANYDNGFMKNADGTPSTTPMPKGLWVPDESTKTDSDMWSVAVPSGFTCGGTPTVTGKKKR